MKTAAWTTDSVVAWVAELDANCPGGWQTRFLPFAPRRRVHLDVARWPSGGYRLAACVDDWREFPTASALAAEIMRWVKLLSDFKPRRPIRVTSRCACIGLPSRKPEPIVATFWDGVSRGVHGLCRECRFDALDALDAARAVRPP